MLVPIDLAFLSDGLTLLEPGPERVMKVRNATEVQQIPGDQTRESIRKETASHSRLGINSCASEDVVGRRSDGCRSIGNEVVERMYQPKRPTLLCCSLSDPFPSYLRRPVTTLSNAMGPDSSQELGSPTTSWHFGGRDQRVRPRSRSQGLTVRGVSQARCRSQS